MKTIITKIIITTMIFLFSLVMVNAATLTCEQVSSESIEISQFSSNTIEIRCTASEGGVSNIQITPNSNPSSGLTFSSTDTMSSSLSDEASDTAKWSVTGDLPNDYDVSYSLSSDGTETWSGSDETEVSVTSPAQLTIEYESAPSEYSDGGTLDIKITNIGGATANNVKVQLNSGSKKSYPTSIEAGSTASYSWTDSTGYDGADTYTTKVYVGSILHDSDETTVSEATNDGGDDGGSGGGGGPAGGGGGGGALEVIKFGDVIDSGTQIINNTGFSFQELSITVLAEVINAKVYVEKFGTLSTDDYPEIDGTVFQYQKVSSSNVKDENLESVSFDFRVEKTWMDENDVLISRIFILRYNGNNWVQESVNVVDSDDEYVYYTASSPSMGMFAVASLPEVELDYLAMSSLIPALIDLEMVIESALLDSLVIDRTEGYLGRKINVKDTIQLSHDLVSSLDIKREVQSTGNASTMTVTITNNQAQPASFIFIEAVPKTIVYDIYELYNFVPRKYDIIIREDPVIQWSFGSADTAVVAWDIQDLGAGDTATFSYDLDAVFNVDSYPAPIIVVPAVSVEVVEAAEDTDGVNEAEVGDSSGSSRMNKIFILLGLIVVLGVVVFVLNQRQGKKPKDEPLHHEPAEHKKEHHKAEHHPKEHKHKELAGHEEKITHYIEVSRKHGVSDVHIKEKLMDTGWEEDQIKKFL